MAGAPHKQGLDFFSFDVTTFDENNIQELLEVHKAEGFLFFLQIRCAILRKSNFLEWNKHEQRDFRKKNEYTNTQIDVYLNFLLDTGLLSRVMYDQYNILTSEDIQGRYILATKERSKVIYIQEYTLINFDDFRHLKQIIHIYNRAGELLERFSKKGGLKINPETNQPIKKMKVTAAAEPVQVDIPKPSAEAKATKPPYPEHTAKEVNAYIKIPYESRDELFKETYTKNEYEVYVQLNKKINSHYDQVRKSNRQLTFLEFIEFTYETTPTLTGAELESAFKHMATTRITKDTDIYRALEESLQKIREQSGEPPDPVPEDNSYVPDEAYEKAVLSWWGFTSPVTYHKQYALFRSFCKVMYDTGRLEQFKEYFPHYKALKEIQGIKFRHKLANYLGKQADLFIDGEWDAENWEQTLKAEKIINIKNNGASNRKIADPQKGYGKP